MLGFLLAVAADYGIKLFVAVNGTLPGLTGVDRASATAMSVVAELSVGEPTPEADIAFTVIALHEYFSSPKGRIAVFRTKF